MTFPRRQSLYLAQAIAALYRGDVGPTIINTGTDTQVRIEEAHTGEWFVLFPGTASKRDVITDLDARFEKWGGHRVHRGFANAFRSVADAVQDAIPTAARVVIAGHSLGGALATLCADAFQDIWTIEGVHTFGSPRVGNAGFAGEYASGPGVRTWRIVNAGDPVPHVPWRLGRYRHVHQLVYLNRHGGVDVNFLVAAARDLAARFTPPPADADRRLISVNGHSISEYVRKLEALR